MRRIISFILIICLLHTQNYHATADVMEEQPSSSVWQRGLSKVAFWRSSDANKNMHLAQLESGGATADVKSLIEPSDIMISLKQHASALKERKSAFVNTPMGFTTVFLAGTVLVFYSLYLYLVGFFAWFDDIPFDVASKRLTHSYLSAFQPFDVCQNFLGNRKDLDRTRSFSHYDHASGYNGVPFAEALPQWFNNANNLVAMLSTLVLTDRSVGRSNLQNSYEFENQFKNFLYVNAANMQRNYSCTFTLGESDHLGEITGCQEDFQKEVYTSAVQIPEAADAMIQFRRWDYKRGFMFPSDLVVRVSFNHNHLNSQRYPQLDYSPNHAHVDDVERRSMQRRLKQLDNNPLTLPEAVADRVSNNLQIMTQLNNILSKLRLWERVSNADVLVLSGLVRSVFNANQIALTSDIGCDVGFENGMFKLLSCFAGVARDTPEGASIPDEGQVWFVRQVGNGVSYVSAIAKKAPVAEAMAIWLKQSTMAMQNLWGVANTLHHRVCNGTSDGQLDLLRKAAQGELMNHGADLQGDLGCDIRFNDAGTEEILCHSGTAPQLKVEGCDLESNVPVRWEGKLWLKPHSLNAGCVDKVIVATTPLWQASRSQTRPYSPSVDMSDEVKPSGSETPSNEASQKVTPSDSDSASNELSDEVTSSDSDTASAEMSDDVTSSRSGSSSNERTNEVSDSVSNASPSHSPTLPNANTTSNGITELYYVEGNVNVRKAIFNGTHMLNDTLFLSRSSFNPGDLLLGVYVDIEFPKIYWSTRNVTNNQYKNIYVADIVLNPTRLNNTRIVYSAPAQQVSSVYLSKASNRIFWTTGTGDVYMGKLNITNPTQVTDVTTQSISTIVPNGYLSLGLYYDPDTQALLWVRSGGSPNEGIIYKSTLNLQTNMLMNTIVLLNKPLAIYSVSYNVKNRRIFFSHGDNQIYSASFSFANPKPLTNISIIPVVGYPYAIFVVND